MGTPGTIVRLLAAALPLLAAAAVRADALDGELEIRSAYAVSSHGVIMLSARVAYPSSELLSATLKDGVTLSFDLECTVTHRRHLWFDAEAVSLLRHSELSYQVVTDRYLLRNHRHRHPGGLSDPGRGAGARRHGRGVADRGRFAAVAR